MKLTIIDALPPFIDPENPPTNWSGIPFDRFDPKNDYTRVCERFETFCRHATSMGYTALSVDNLAHLAILHEYSPSLKRKLEKYQRLYQKLFTIAEAYRLKIFVNTDIMYFHKDASTKDRQNHQKIQKQLVEAMEYLFLNYRVHGVITRIGECDGMDVRSDFKSALTIKTPQQARNYISSLLTVFEKHNKLWIFRTWTLGAYPIGDLMWNQHTFVKTFAPFQNRLHLILSIKDGDADFFRFLDLNPLFSLKGYRKIVELQAKREYDGFGDLPFYTGWDYKMYYDQLKNDQDLAGIMVWCQSGGWKKNQRVTFFENSSPWTELNTVSTSKIFQGADPDRCIQEYFGSEEMIRFLKKYNDLSGRIIYPHATKAIYFFRKVRIPPLLWMLWDTITVNTLTSWYFRILGDRLTVDPSEIEELHTLGTRCGIPDTEFICDTLDILYKCRLAMENGSDPKELKEKTAAYTKKYPHAFKFSIADRPLDQARPGIILRSMIRRSSHYRLFDSLFLNTSVAAFLARFYLKQQKKSFPSITDQQGMPAKELVR